MPNRTKDDLWERQPGESAQAYEAFAIYRDMGSNRSLRVVAEQLSKSDTLIKRWSTWMIRPDRRHSKSTKK